MSTVTTCLSRIARLDRQYPDDFKLQPIRGYADEHELTLKLDRSVAARVKLLLTGWTDYAWSSDNLAASQSGKSLHTAGASGERQTGTMANGRLRTSGFRSAGRKLSSSI